MRNGTIAPATWDEFEDRLTAELARLQEERAQLQADLTRLSTERVNTRHRFADGYLHGGVYASVQMSAVHIVLLAGLLEQTAEAVLEALEIVEETIDGACDLLSSVRLACETWSGLEIAGWEWLDRQSLLKNGQLNGYWLTKNKHKLGLGQHAMASGLGLEHALGHRGLYTLDVAEMRQRFAAHDKADRSFGQLLRPVIEAGGSDLARLGETANRTQARLRYEEDCRRFAEHQARNPDRSWRWRPAKSRQGHLARTTATELHIDMPAKRTRGHAANWLDDRGANLRHRGEDR